MRNGRAPAQARGVPPYDQSAAVPGVVLPGPGAVLVFATA